MDGKLDRSDRGDDAAYPGAPGGYGARGRPGHGPGPYGYPAPGPQPPASGRRPEYPPPGAVPVSPPVYGSPRPPDAPTGGSYPAGGHGYPPAGPSYPGGSGPRERGLPPYEPERRPSRIARKVNYDDEGRHAARRERPGKRPRSRGPMPLTLELPLLLVVAFCLAVLIRTFLVQAFYIPSGSMENTLAIDDRVLVNKVVYGVRGIKRGEVIVFQGGGGWKHEVPVSQPTSTLGHIGRTFGDLIGISQPKEKDFIKRVIGLPGDKISCCDAQGRVVVNGHPLDESYIFEPSQLVDPSQPHSCMVRNIDEMIVPPGQLFVMGDHRMISSDSRCSGTVAIKDVVGRAFLVVWPKKHWATLEPPDTFANGPDTAALGAPAGPLPSVDTTAFGVVGLPILASLAISARSARIYRHRGRRLPW